LKEHATSGFRVEEYTKQGNGEPDIGKGEAELSLWVNLYKTVVDIQRADVRRNNEGTTGEKDSG
jgi:hypothetical protein